jgi:hypothetical protein
LAAQLLAADMMAIYRQHDVTALSNSKGQKRLSPTMLQLLFGPTLGASEIFNHHHVTLILLVLANATKHFHLALFRHLSDQSISNQNITKSAENHKT